MSMIKQEHLTYLDKLRESGKTNMFGARPYLRREFPLIADNQADTILEYWMENFNPEGTTLKKEEGE